MSQSVSRLTAAPLGGHLHANAANSGNSEHTMTEAKEPRTYAFRASPEVEEGIEEHFSRMTAQMPGVLFTKTQAISSLILRGIASVREDDRKQHSEGA